MHCPPIPLSQPPCGQSGVAGVTAVRRAREVPGTDGGSVRMAMTVLELMLWWSTAIQTDHVMAVSSQTL